MRIHSLRTKIRQLLFAAVLILIPGVVGAELESTAPDDSRTLDLVDRLKEVIQRAERNRNIPSTPLNQLKELVKHYDWQWRVKLLYDNFADGDYTANPAWTVMRGDFRIVRGAGLRSVVGLEATNQLASIEADRGRGKYLSADALGGVLKEFSDPAGLAPFRNPRQTAEISTQVAIANAFAVRVRMASYETGLTGLRVEFGPYRGNDRDWGYRLAYTPGRTPPFEMLRLAPGRVSVMAASAMPMSLEDGRIHQFEWRRDREGTMLVLLDGQEILRSVDRSAEFFDGFTIVNGGGDYSFERIEIFGAGG